MPDCIQINIYVYPGQGKTCVYKTLINSYVRPWAKPFKSNCSWRKAMGNHLHICTSYVNDDASAMTVLSRTCLRAENSSSSYSNYAGCLMPSLLRFTVLYNYRSLCKFFFLVLHKNIILFQKYDII